MNLLNGNTNGVPDSQCTINQTISADSEALSGINTAENPYKFSMDIKAAGNVEGNLTAKESGYSNAMKNDAILGACPELIYDSTCKIDSVVLKFNIDSKYISNDGSAYAASNPEFVGIKRYNVFKYFDDINMLLPVETKFDVANNLLYADVDQLGTYCVMDMEKWLKGLGIVPDTQQSVDNNSSEQQVSNSAQAVTDFQVNNKIQTPLLTNTNQGTNTDGIVRYIFNGHQYAIIDKSMLWTDAKSYCEKLGGHLATISSQAENAFIAKITTDSSTNYVAIGYSDALNEGKWEWVNGEKSDYTNWDLRYPEPNNGIGNGEQDYAHLYTNGTWDDGWNDLKTAFVCEWENKKPEFPAILATSDKVVLNAELVRGSTTDTDDDGLTDWDEVDTTRIANIKGVQESTLSTITKNDLPTFKECSELKGGLFYVKEGLDRYFTTSNKTMEQVKGELYSTRILPIVSDPTKPDSDGDGITDGSKLIGEAKYTEDAKPLKYSFKYYDDKLYPIHLIYPDATFKFDEYDFSLDKLARDEYESGYCLTTYPSMQADTQETNRLYKKTAIGLNDWYYANLTSVKNYCDINTYLDKQHIFAFCDLRNCYDSKVENAKKILKGTYFDQDDKLDYYAQSFVEASTKNNIDLSYLISRCISECSSGTKGHCSKLCAGNIATKGKSKEQIVYNMFGVGATDNLKPDINGDKGPLQTGITRASNECWTTEKDAIIGGTRFDSDKYVGKEQYTLYLQKYNLVDYSKTSKIVNQYMTAIHAAYTDGNGMCKNKNKYLSQFKDIVFVIPVYSDYKITQ